MDPEDIFQEDKSALENSHEFPIDLAFRNPIR